MMIRSITIIWFLPVNMVAVILPLLVSFFLFFFQADDINIISMEFLFMIFFSSASSSCFSVTAHFSLICVYSRINWAACFVEVIYMIPRQQIRYSRLPAVEDDHDNGGRQHEYLPKSYNKIPWKSIFLALFLLVLGCFLLFLSFFMLTGHMTGDSTQAYSLLGLGILAFLPGMSRIW